MSDSDHAVDGGTRQHVTDGGPCWCNPTVEHVEGTLLQTTFPSDMVNLSGKEDEPMWVERSEVAAIGVFGPNDSLVVLRSSGVKLRCKDIHPNEVVQLVTGQVSE